MRRSLVVLVCLPILSVCGPGQTLAAGEPISVAVSARAQPVERAAAEELAGYLGRIYPDERFTIAEHLPATGRAILVVNVRGDSRLAELVAKKPTEPESYLVTTARNGELGVVAGADCRGVVYGVYALLEKLGCGFYLSYDGLPSARRDPFTFAGWQLADRPLVRDRLALNWHNFLSGCSSWNLADWKAWILQLQKQGYNAIMVHAYGNNPMVSYSFNGKTKPVGYLPTTIQGRDWSTMHVNDVRRLWGGEVFASPVFGSDAALVPDDQRVASAQQLMRQVFDYAAKRSMGVFFATDVDTIAANPQEVILTLPASARFTTVGAAGAKGPVWLAHPDTPEGYQFYRTQVEALLKAYPGITCLVAWFRPDPTPWINLKLEEMPAEWQEEYQAEIAKTPEAADFRFSLSVFAVGKLVRAYERALQELANGRVELAAGSWFLHFVPAADRFLPPQVKLLGLSTEIHQPGIKLPKVAAVGTHRLVVPITWAHHDDFTYIGRAHTPIASFHSQLAETQASGFGVIHWTTRPLDLYFSSLIKQVWHNSRDQSLSTTCDEMAERSFGAPTRQTMGKYLYSWATKAPIFARDTSDKFVSAQLKDVAQVVTGCRERRKLIDSVDASALTPQQQQRLDYYRGLEGFISGFYQTHDKFQDAEERWQKGDCDAASAMMADCQPERIIEQFARFSSLGGITRGEQGLVVSMNARWLPHYVRLRQTLGLEPIRYHFGPTSHDAFGGGSFTFFFDNQRHLWQTLGTKETGADTFVRSGGTADLCCSGIESDKPWRVTLQPILYPTPLRPGRYVVRLWILDPTSTAAGQRVFDVSVNAGSLGDRYAFEPVRSKYLRLECHGNSQDGWNSIQEVQLRSLAKDQGAPRATASGAVANCLAEYAVDGKPETRWAVAGTNQWIQFRLDPQATTSELGILWFRGETRQTKFEIVTSDDGQHWSGVPYRHVTSAKDQAPSAPDRVDIFQEVGGANRLLVRSYPVIVAPWGKVELTLTPVVGKALLCAIALEPLGTPQATDQFLR